MSGTNFACCGRLRIYNMSRLLRAYEYFCGLLLFYDASSGLTEKYSTKPMSLLPNKKMLC
jgi:hypothetical protein